MDDHLVHTMPNHQPTKMDILTKTFVQNILDAKWLVWHSSTSPKQLRRPLPSLRSLSLILPWRLFTNEQQAKGRPCLYPQDPRHTADSYQNIANYKYTASKSKHFKTFHIDKNSFESTLYFCNLDPAGSVAIKFFCRWLNPDLIPKKDQFNTIPFKLWHHHCVSWRYLIPVMFKEKNWVIA